MRCRPALGIVASVCLFASEAAAQAPAANLEDPPVIDNFLGDLYRFQVGARTSVFLVTPEGIVLADPLGSLTSRALRKELETRFPNRPVRYVLHTGYRFERSEGAATFNDTAELVGHRAFNGQVSRARRADSLSYRFVRDVETVYDSQRTITLGGRNVHLTHLRGADGEDATAVSFPLERVVFVEGFPDLSQSFAAVSFTPKDALAWLQAMAALDFDILLTGSGTTIPKADIEALIRYLNALNTVVMSGYDRGLSIEQLQAGTFLEAHRGTPFYAQRLTHIAETYRALRAIRVNVHAAGAINGLTANSDYCASYTECGRDALVPAATIGVSWSVRRIAAVAEVSLERQAFASRIGLRYDDAWAHRESTGSFLVGVTTAPDRAWSLNVLGGLSITRVDSDGLLREKFVSVNLGGVSRQHNRAMRLGISGGTDVLLPISGRLRVIVPVRVMYGLGEPDQLRPGPLSLRAGAGLRFRLYRSPN
jgi:hypothetical protein